jgi:hypothetical protein
VKEIKLRSTLHLELGRRVLKTTGHARGKKAANSDVISPSPASAQALGCQPPKLFRSAIAEEAHN